MTPSEIDAEIDRFHPDNFSLSSGGNAELWEAASKIKAATTPTKAKAARASSGKLPHHAAGELYLRGPVPLDWLGAAAQLPGKALHVANLLWWLGGLEKKGVNPVHWRPSAAAGFGLDRKAVYRGVAALEAAGLVSVERRRGRCPIITILPFHPKED